MCRALLASATCEMITQQARRSSCVFCHLFYTRTLSHDCLLPHALIQSLARMLLPLCHSLAFFLLLRLTRSLVCFLPSSFPPYLPYSVTRSFVCFLPHSFPLIARLILTFYTPSLPHSLTYTIAFLLLHFLTNYLARSLSLLSLLTRPLAFSTHSLTSLLTQ